MDRTEKIKLYGSAHALLVEALNRFPRDMWHFKPAPDDWSIHQIVIHITDSEANSYVRCRRAIAEPGSDVIAYDEMRWADALDYHGQSTDDAVELFRWLRKLSHSLILAQPETAWSHTIRHPENGPMTLDDWLDVYARHVPEHIAQMERVYAAWLAAQQS